MSSPPCFIGMLWAVFCKARVLHMEYLRLWRQTRRWNNLASSFREADRYKKVPRITRFKELVKLLDVKSQPLLVTISGSVDSDTPIDCRDSGSRAVIYVEKAEKHFLLKCDKKSNGAENKKRNVEKEWVRKSELMLSRRREVPWYLHDGTDHRVHVLGCDSSSLLTVGSQVFVVSGDSGVRSHNHPDLENLGVKRIEWVLPIGKFLTVIGRAVKDESGRVSIQNASPCWLDRRIAMLEHDAWQADWYKTVPRITRFKELVKLLDDKRRPLIVTISGRVGSNTPIDCPDSGSRAVILVERAEKHFLVKCNKKENEKENEKKNEKKNDAKNEKRIVEKEWVRKSELMSSRRREVPWYLHDGTDHRVHVLGCDSYSLLTVASNVFEDSRLRSHNHRDLEMLGVKRIEWVLPIGKYLTVIGSAVKDESGRVSIQNASPCSLDQRIAILEGDARMNKAFSAIAGVVGVVMMIHRAFFCNMPIYLLQ
ncbi:hypothetical protein Tsubulata_038220 [Turnera subulata]|uniref:RING-type E3 ubiquitin transferase n=1 Tax=Turnera subulata TaxID=218843 RepID=A0A9Q0GG33_9ROSI|nr:hypothetical protein Tsubulata_038220 [Turnera subulata]